ncbi:MAG: NAD-glutamate dehydrogenase domain-containing protein, partial [Pseudomonadota bacterium]
MLIATDESWENRVAAVRRLAEERLDDALMAAFGPALDRFIASAAPDEIVALDAEEIYGAALALWQFARVRQPGVAKARVYNPAQAEHGWSSRHSIIEVVNDDMPFLVDSMTVLLNERGLGIHALIHPVMAVTRDALGARDAAGETVTESLMQLQVDQIGTAEGLADLEAAVHAMLADVRAAVVDWRAMLAELAAAGEALEQTAPDSLGDSVGEAVAFLQGLGDNHFTFLGCRSFRADSEGHPMPVEDTGLGLMRDIDYTVMRDRQGNTAHWTAEMAEMRAERDPVLILKANRRSTVHRGSHFDVIAVAEYAADGSILTERVFAGLFTSAAYNRLPQTIPLLREKVGRVIARAGFAPASHDAKALDNVLEKYPRDELFQSTDEQLYANARGVLQLVTRPRTRLFVRPDRFGRFLSCLVYVPRDRYRTELRVRLGDILCAAVKGRVASWEPSFDMEALARVHFVVALTEGMPASFDLDRVERQVVEVTRSWHDRLRDALVERHGEHEGHRLYRRWGVTFRAAYRENSSIATALGDIAKLDGIGAENPLALHFYRRLEDAETVVRFKMFHYRKAVPLSDCLPVLEHMGLKVMAEQPHKLKVEGVNHWIHDFEMSSRSGETIDLTQLRAKLEDAFAAAWGGSVDDDPMNRLVLVAGLDHGAVDVLRAYSRFLRQARIPYSVDYMEDALAENPAIARALIDLFMARFDPSTGLDVVARDVETSRLTAEIEAALDAVPSLDVDRILRRFLNAVLSTLRTNAFQKDADGRVKDYVSFKFDCAALDDLPLPRPWREIFVYAPWVEGVHLRGGPVARGGLRWSDRKEDYRTEILGLVKAQQVKNAV